ncbi:hypothetical protein [Pyrobaculum sp.]|uniref:hypothetical protein n=1 Tax=Pyrobaculum sp. TaxID=2004705 RepID=UPI003D133A5F
MARYCVITTPAAVVEDAQIGLGPAEDGPWRFLFSSQVLPRGQLGQGLVNYLRSGDQHLC